MLNTQGTVSQNCTTSILKRNHTTWEKFHIWIDSVCYNTQISFWISDHSDWKEFSITGDKVCSFILSQGKKLFIKTLNL